MPNLDFAVVLRQDLPEEFISLMDGYINNEGGLLYLHCRSIEHLGPFIMISAVKDSSSPQWPIQIPVGYVIAIADMSVPHAGPGFLSRTP
jgi:hypothetical protein